MVVHQKLAQKKARSTSKCEIDVSTNGMEGLENARAVEVVAHFQDNEC